MTGLLRVLEWSLVMLAILVVWTVAAALLWATIVTLVKRGGKR